MTDDARRILYTLGWHLLSGLTVVGWVLVAVSDWSDAAKVAALIVLGGLFALVGIAHTRARPTRAEVIRG